MGYWCGVRNITLRLSKSSLDGCQWILRTTPISLDFVLRLCRGPSLPLHVPGRISAATLQRDHVIDHVALAGPRGLAGCRAGIAGLECSSGRRASRDPAVGGAGAVAAFLRRGSGASDGCAALRSGRGSRRTPRCRAGGAAAAGGPRRGRGDQEAERQDQARIIMYDSIGGSAQEHEASAKRANDVLKAMKP